MQEIERHIFVNAHNYFLEKKFLFQELYVDCTLAVALTDSSTPLLELDFSINKSISEDFFAEVLISIAFNPPLIMIQSISNKLNKSDYSIFEIKGDGYFDDIISIETISNYNNQGKTACKIHQIFPSDLTSINNHWL